jgi:hypothetical protein
LDKFQINKINISGVQKIILGVSDCIGKNGIHLTGAVVVKADV